MSIRVVDIILTMLQNFIMSSDSWKNGIIQTDRYIYKQYTKTRRT